MPSAIRVITRVQDQDDVSVSSLASNNVLQWNGSAWVNKTPAQLAATMSLADMGTRLLTNLSDIPAPTNDYALFRKADGTGYEWRAVSAGVTDHGALTGLADDDHSQYALLAPASSARNVVQPTGAAVVPLVLKGASLQTGDLLQFHSSGGTSLLTIGADGSVSAKDSSGTTRAKLLVTGTRGYLDFPGNDDAYIQSRGNTMFAFQSGAEILTNQRINLVAGKNIWLATQSSRLEIRNQSGSNVVDCINGSDNTNHLSFDITNKKTTLTPLTVDHTNARVGIGDTSPSVKMTIKDAAAAQIMVYGYGDNTGASDLNGMVLLGNNASYRGIIDYDGKTSGILYIKNSYNNDGGDITFQTKTSGTAINAMRIRGSGRIYASAPSTFNNLADSAWYAHPLATTESAMSIVGRNAQSEKLVRFKQVSDTTTFRDAAFIDAVFATATDASRKGRLIFYAADASSTREGMRIESDGSNPMVGFLGATAVLRQTIGAAATDAATTQTLANNIRTALINLGLCQN